MIGPEVITQTPEVIELLKEIRFNSFIIIIGVVLCLIMK